MPETVDPGPAPFGVNYLWSGPWPPLAKPQAHMGKRWEPEEIFIAAAVDIIRKKIDN